MADYYIRDVIQSKEQIENLTEVELFNINIHCMRKSLFKYFPNITVFDNRGNSHNYSLEALKNNTVYLSSPTNFDDPYDCNIYLDHMDFLLQRIRYYANLCGVTVKDGQQYEEIAEKFAKRIYEHLSFGNPIESLCSLSNDLLVKAHQEYFLLALKVELTSPYANGDSYYKAINHVINREFSEIQEAANRFRISCFTENPYSMLMWSHYARGHQGFCIEYETPDYSDENADLYHNLFPVIYTDTRSDLTKMSLNWKSTGRPTNEELWDFYKYGLLSKSLDWKYQREWRLISYDDCITDSNYNCKFFKIKKVYLGNKMQSDDRKEIITICKNKGIPYSGVTIAPERFEMKDCGILCENCERMK